MLTLGPNLTLPLDAVTRTFGVLAVRGAGKSNTAAVMAEEMFAAKLPFVVIDPVGSWYGLRSSADGTAPGLAIPIFGGKHGDIPLERGAGELVADTIVEQRLSCVLDLSRMDSEAAKKQFLLAFATRLYQRNEDPLHLFLEEADDYIPQKPMRDEAALLRAWENIVRRGRARGLGMTLITQRSAAIAKMVLTQVETLFAMRTTGPQDLAAIEAWVKYHQVGREVLSTLASLEDGEAWVWSPHFLKTLKRVQIRRRRTFDSGATPKNVKASQARPAATLADVDLAQLQARMAATIERARADDPRELRKRILELREQLGSKLAVATRPRTVERPVLTDAQLARLEVLIARTDTAVARAETALQAPLAAVAAALSAVAAAVRSVRQPALPLPALPRLPPRPPVITLGGTVEAPTSRQNEPGGPFCVPGAMSRAFLTALAQYPAGLQKGKMLAYTDYRSSGATSRAFASLVQEGWADPVPPAGLRITPRGLEVLGPFERLPTGQALQTQALGKLSTMERAILTRLFACWPGDVGKGELLEAAGYKSSGATSRAFSHLVAIDYAVPAGSARLKAADVFFE